MFEHLTSKNKIIVSGPQRSGTTICAKMIAYDTGFTFYPEERVNVADHLLIKRLIETEDKFVLQCPSICAFVHTYNATIVIVRRPINDIIISEVRVGWQGHRELELSRYGLSEGIISEEKYKYWDNYQKSRTQDYIEVDYNDLQSHPLWVSKKDRLNFGPRQIC